MNVYISYAQSDAALAESLAAHLAEAGCTVWWGGEDQLLPGENWALKVGKALEKADAMVVLLSPSAVAYPPVRREIDFALLAPQFADRLIPVIVQPSEQAPWILKTMNPLQAGESPALLARKILDRLQVSMT